MASPLLNSSYSNVEIMRSPVKFADRLLLSYLQAGDESRSRLRFDGLLTNHAAPVVVHSDLIVSDEKPFACWFTSSRAPSLPFQVGTYSLSKGQNSLRDRSGYALCSFY